MTLALVLPQATWETLALVFTVFALGAIFLQQALFLVFGWDFFIKLNERQVKTDTQPRVYRFIFDLKPLVSLLCAELIVFHFGFDFFSGIMGLAGNDFSLFMTGVGYSGGSAFVHHYLKDAREAKEAMDAAKIRAVDK